MTFEWATGPQVPDDSFGNLRWQNTLEEVENRYLFQGREWDSNRQDYYFRNRIYVPEWGCFTGPDMNLANGILGEPNGVGSYIAFDNDPLDIRDPLGLDWWSNTWKGDFDSEENSWGGVAGQVGVGIIPVVGQIADARDTVANLRNVIQTPDSITAWAGLGAAAVGWIPVAGDALKGGVKVGKKVAIEAGESALSRVEKKILNEGADATAREAKSLSKAAKTVPEDLTYLYQKVGAQGEHLKFGITKNPATRYAQEELAGGKLRIVGHGPREEMLQLERNIHETLPIGPEEAQKFYIQKQVQKGLKPPPYGGD